MIHTDKIKYKVLISDDNPLFVKRLTPKISEINYHNMHYSIDIDTCLSPDACIENLKNNIYDIIILDVCRSRSNEYTQTNSDFLRESVQPDYCGIDLYEEAVKHNPSAKIFILSNLKVYDIRTLFNNAEAEYFSKNQNVEIEIARCIKNYFDTGKKRILNNIFIVYGKNEYMKMAVTDYIEHIGLKTIDLYEDSPSGLQSIFNALLNCASVADCAIVLLSADEAIINKETKKTTYRAQQNVIFEMGFFAGFLGKNKVIVLYEKNSNFEFPSGISDIFYIDYDPNGKWKDKLYSNLIKIGFEIN